MVNSCVFPEIPYLFRFFLPPSKKIKPAIAKIVTTGEFFRKRKKEKVL